MEPECVALVEHWRRVVEDRGGLPWRVDIDPLDLPSRTLPFMHIYEVHRGVSANRYRCRLAGTRMADGLGGDPTGRYLDEMMRPDLYPTRSVFFDLVVSERAPVYYRATLAAPNREFIGFSRLLVPVRDDGDADRVGFVFGVMVFSAPGGGRPGEDEAADAGNGVIRAEILRDGVWKDLRTKIRGVLRRVG